MKFKAYIADPSESLEDKMRHINLRETPIPVDSPWGKVESHGILGPGMVQVTTASHGGIRVYEWRLSLMDPSLVIPNGWYENNSQWCLPVIAFSEEFTSEVVGEAIKTFRDAFPERHQAYFKTATQTQENGMKS